MAGNNKHQLAMLYLVWMSLRWRGVARWWTGRLSGGIS